MVEAGLRGNLLITMRAGTKSLFWVAVAAATVALGLSSALADAGQQGGSSAGSASTLRATSASFPDYMDPALSYTFEGWNAMYDTYIPLLTYRRAEGKAGSEVIPGLARGLPKITDGGRTYTLFLRPGLKYSDGTRVRASDFEFAVERMFSLNSGGSPFYTSIAGARQFLRTGRGGISGIATDNGTGKIVIHLVKPRGTFADELALMFVAPVPPDTPMRAQSFHPPPGTGPYVFTSSRPGRGWSLVRNPQWGANNEKRLPQLPSGHVDAIDVKVVRDGEAQVDSILQGKSDWMNTPPPVDRYGELLRKYGGSQFRVEPTLSTYYFWMNTTRPPFDDPRVRKAVNYAVDTSALRRIYADQLVPTHQILPPGMPGYRKFDLYPHSLAKARKLIAMARPKDREITVWTDTESPNEEAGAYYASALKQLGFKVHLKVVNADNYFTVIGNRSTPNLDTGWSNWFADYAHPSDWFQPLLAGASILSRYNWNFSLIDAPSLNAKIAELGRQPLGPAQERQYAALDRSYMELAPWVPYGTRTLSTFVSKRVDLSKVVWNPLIGPSLTSFQFK
jgi:peptide/nickel transport system substrate-binding protein